MKNIVLFCAAGMSTSLLVTKMREAAAKQEFECEVNAYPIAEAEERGKDADIILLGPQVRFQLKEVKSKCPNIPVESIDMAAYGMMDGTKVINQVKKSLGL